MGYCRQQAQLLQAEMAEVESEDDGRVDENADIWVVAEWQLCREVLPQ